MASPSGYERLVAAGSSLTGTAILDLEVEPSHEEAARYLDANRDALCEARNALRQNCAVPLEYDAGFFERHCEDYSPLRNLGRSFAVELDAAVLAGDLFGAIDAGLTLIDVANGVRRGGLVVDALVGNTIEGVAVDRMRIFRRRLGPDNAIRLANGLMQRDAARETFDKVAARDRKWEESVRDPNEATEPLAVELPDNIAGDEAEREAQRAILEALRQMAEVPKDDLNAVAKKLDDRNIALMRLLAVESAVIAFQAETGAYPSDLCELATDCIGVIPTDPFTGDDFKYRRTAIGFVLYSPGPTRTDSGGIVGNWWSVLSGDADLFLDMHDCEDACCVVSIRQTLFSRIASFLGRAFRP